jgi:hypothetical protein
MLPLYNGSRASRMIGPSRMIGASRMIGLSRMTRAAEKIV